jgi:superoxide reductase
MALNNYLKQADEGKEKHTPDISVRNCSGCGELNITIHVGKEVLHPSTNIHSIKTITLYGITKENKIEQLTVFQLGDENTVPRVRTSVKKDIYIKLIATSYCNLHGLWENEINL